jgi:magnesium chelatase subunit I
MFIVFTANPEDYTNRGNIITPLKDRIDSQILTHYPKTIDEGIRITESESWVNRNSGAKVVIPFYLKEIVEIIAHEARSSEFVEQKSGVSARMPISVMENLISNAERRSIINKEDVIFPRITDLQSVLPGMTGKIELVFEGEQEGTVKVSRALIGKSIKQVFRKYFPDPLQRRSRKEETAGPGNEIYGEILKWFGEGNMVELSDEMTFRDYFATLRKVKGLENITKKYVKTIENDYELATMMEFVLDGLHNNSKIAKDEADDTVSYKDMLGSMLRESAPRDDARRSSYDYEQDWNY